MKKVKKLVVGNWKMNPVSLEEARKIVGTVKRNMKNIKRTEVVFCPPFVYLSPLSKAMKGSLSLGAQDANSETAGPFTGEVGHLQLPQFGVKYVIVGHSERRNMGETDEIVNKKVQSVTSLGMTAIVCVGESSRDANGEYLDFVKQQILKALKDVPKKSFENIVIAYEPIWAIGAKQAMTSLDLHEMSIFIKKVLKDSYSIASDGVRIIYGGSVDRVNASSLVKEGNVSGLLVGRQSLESKDFVEIINLVDAQ
ncbi:MAG: triose-phosphate isomerase [Parcubacteria bacterium C7867-006]|nr:MAG: triose-phosphate isomerase [Parcubacteria bacterium C7867-006]